MNKPIKINLGEISNGWSVERLLKIYEQTGVTFTKDMKKDDLIQDIKSNLKGLVSLELETNKIKNSLTQHRNWLLIDEFNFMKNHKAKMERSLFVNNIAVQRKSYKQSGANNTHEVEFIDNATQCFRYVE